MSGMFIRSVLAFSLLSVSFLGACADSADDTEAPITSNSELQAHLASSRLSADAKQHIASGIHFSDQGQISVKAKDLAALPPATAQAILGRLGVETTTTAATGGAHPGILLKDFECIRANGECLSFGGKNCNPVTCGQE